MIYEEFKDRAGDVVSGTVRRFDRNDVLVDLGKFEGVMPIRERVQGEAEQDAPAKVRQLAARFDDAWQRSRPISEYRALGL